MVTGQRQAMRDRRPPALVSVTIVCFVASFFSSLDLCGGFGGGLVRCVEFVYVLA